jgi:hypothetical protein
MANAAYVINGWLVDPLFGCTDPAYQEFNSDAILDDGSCITLFSSLYDIQSDSLTSMNLNMDTLQNQFDSLTTTSQTEILNMQASFDSLTLLANQNIFNLNDSLTDSLNLTHQDYNNQLDFLMYQIEDSLNNVLNQLNQDFQDTLVYIQNNLQASLDSMNFVYSQLQSDSLLIEQEIADTLAYYNAVISGINTMHNAAVTGLESQITSMITNYLDIILLYEARVDSTNLANSYSQDSLILLHSIEMSNQANSLDSLNDILTLTIQTQEQDTSLISYNYQSQISNLNSTYQDSLAEIIYNDGVEDLAFINQINGLQSDSTLLSNNLIQTSSDLAVTQDSLLIVSNHIDSLIVDSTYLQQNFDYYSALVYVNLAEGWNMIGFPLQEPMNAAASLQSLGSNLHLIKDNYANVYWPEFGFSSLENLIPGQGYQVRMYNSVDNFAFEYIGDQRLEVSPTVPSWVNDLVPVHTSESRELISVVNLLGQQVDPKIQSKGEVLIYLFSDGSAEKIIKK